MAEFELARQYLARCESGLRAGDALHLAIASNHHAAAVKVQILGGAPGTGKTTIAMTFAGTISTGGRWPDGSRSQTGNVVIWSGEDDPADTLVPRLALAGANLRKIFFVADVRMGGKSRPFDPARDVEVLRRKLIEVGGVICWRSPRRSATTAMAVRWGRQHNSSPIFSVTGRNLYVSLCRKEMVRGIRGRH